MTIADTALGPDHPNVAACLNNLATVLCALGQPAAAQPLLERAVTIAEKAYGPDHPDVAACLNSLSTALCALGQPAAAQPLLQRAATITEQAYGSGHATPTMLGDKSIIMRREFIGDD